MAVLEGERHWFHGALNDMAAAVLEVSLIALLAVVTVSDLRTRLVPDAPLAAGLCVGLTVSALGDPGSLAERLAAGAGAGGFLLGVALVRPEGMGLGDVKLAGVLGVYLGVAVIEALAIAFAAGSIAGLALLARHGWEARRRTIPFAPCLALGGLAAMATAV
jgi:leader peptidase (prepilin peptidase)/N-methyltransferase